MRKLREAVDKSVGDVMEEWSAPLEYGSGRDDRLNKQPDYRCYREKANFKRVTPSEGGTDYFE
jgi:hypothetical protein